MNVLLRHSFVSLLSTDSHDQSLYAAHSVRA
eukprot:COSAG01_NODE_51358_length_355_cov_1.007812_1_plen_30_part_01